MKIDKFETSYDEQREAIKEAAATFPKEFGLRAFPDDRFIICLADCYVGDDGEIMLYTAVKRGEDWPAFAKGTVEELREEVVA